jgi:hypothetical protein
MKYLEFLETIYNASLSIDDEYVTIPNEYKKTVIYKDNRDIYETLNTTYFNYNINNKPNIATQYNYIIKIYKEPRTFLFFNLKPRYITHVIVKSYQYDLTMKEIFYDTEIDSSFKLQNSLYQFLDERYIKYVDKVNNEGFDKYINDLGKVVDKQFTRDDKLDKLLN